MLLVAMDEVAAVAVLAAVVDVVATTVCCWLCRLGVAEGCCGFLFVMVDVASGTCGCNVGGFGS